MLSIVIPTFKYNTLALVTELNNQCIFANINYEIIVQDDASNYDFNSENEKINSIQNCFFYCNNQNLGRGKNINAIVEKSKFNWILILDCDVSPKTKNFISNYLIQIKSNLNIAFFGGLEYENAVPENDKLLRYIYGKNRESISYTERNKNPYSTALTSNLLISKVVFTSVKFSSDITDYGYEDLIFMQELKLKKVKIVHIDNSVFHLNLETSQLFLDKTATAIKNLSFLYATKKELTKESKIIRTYTKLQRYNLDKLFLNVFTKFENKIKQNLLSNRPKMFLFDMYKLGNFCKLNSK